MKNYPSWRSFGAWSAAVLLFVGLAAPAAWAAPQAYVANEGSGTVSVIDTANDTVGATVTVGSYPIGVAVSPDGSRVYVANQNSKTVSVIDTANDTVGATVTVGSNPAGVAVSPDGSRVYVANAGSGTVSVIDTATDSVGATVTVGTGPFGVAVSPDGSRVYVANEGSGTVSVIDTANDTVGATVTVGSNPAGVAVSPDGSRVYVANAVSDTVSVIDTANDTVVKTVLVGSTPFGVAVSPDGSRVYVANEGSNTVSVIDTANDTVGATVTVGSAPYSPGAFVGPGALIAGNGSASGGAGTQISGTVPTLVNSTSCATTDDVVQMPASGSLVFTSSTGAYTYTPASPTYSGPDAFTWQGGASGSCPSADAPTDPVSNVATVTFTIDPVIAGLAGVTLGENQTTHEDFTLTGSAPFSSPTLTSSNATVLPASDLTVSPTNCGTVGNLSCTLTIASGSTTGKSDATVSTSDEYGDTVQKSIVVTVAAPPTVSGLTSVTTTAPTSGTEGFTIGGTGTLTVTATSSNTTLLPDANITGGGSCTAAGSCTLTLKPAAGQSGSATVTVEVADAYGQSANGTFAFTVKSAPPSSGGSGGGGGISPFVLLMLGVLVLFGRWGQRRSHSHGL